MAWDDAPPSTQELQKIKPAWNSAPPSKDEMDVLSGKSTQGPRPWYSVSKQGLLDSIETAPRSALETLTLGASEPVLSGIHAVDSTFDDAVHGKGASLDSLKSHYNEDVERRRQMKARVPIADVGGGLLGAFSPEGPAAAVAKKVSGAVGKGFSKVLPALEEGGGKLIQAGKNFYGNAANVLEGAAQGSAGALAQEAPRQVIEGTTGFIQPGDKNIPDLGDVASLGGKFGAAVPSLAVAGKALGAGGAYSGKKLMASFLGPSEEHIDYYLKNPQAVNGAKSIEELKDKVDSITEGLRDSVASGEKSVAEAKQNLKDLESKISDHRKQSSFDFQVTSTEVKQALREAKSNLDTAFEQQKRGLKSVKAPIELADEANQAVKDLRDKVTKGSQDARTALDEGEGAVHTFTPFKALQAAKDRLSIAGKGPVTPQAQAAGLEIDKLMKTFGALPGALTFPETKDLLMQLDRSEQAVYNSGEFTDDVSRAYKSLRQSLDAELKAQNPKYAEAMKPVAEDMALHSEVAGKFGDKQPAISRLGKIASPTSVLDREQLASLGEKTGRDFVTPIDAHVNAQNTLKSPEAMEKIRTSLPEFKPHADLERMNQSLEGPSAKAEYVDKNLKSSGLLEQEKASQGLLADQQGGLLKQKGLLEPFRNLNPNSSESRLKTAMNSRSGEQVELKRQLEDLSKLSDTDFVKALKDLKTKNAFNGQDTNGSRKVNLFGMVVGAAAAGAGAVVGHGVLGAGIGVPIGAAAGAVADKYGPKIAKQMLDGVIKIKGSPTVDKIKALEVPPQVKAYLIKELADFNAE